MRRRAELRPILFMNQITKLFLMTLNLNFNLDFRDYNTRSRNNLRKTAAKRSWGHWNSINSVLQMTGIPLICHLGKLLLYPVLNETSPR